MSQLPILIIELPVPAGLETEWNDWYDNVHVPDFLATVDGAVRTTRYQLVGDPGPDELRYLVVHEFDSVDNMTAFKDSPVMNGRLNEYTDLWGIPTHYRRRGFEPIFEAERHA
jgi:antibiotic biosynthesis monooxygenase (ABM) superfamily enzyme